MKKAFVTGATGFIGRRLIEVLSNQGIEVVALTRKKPDDFPQAVKIVHGDILEPESFYDLGRGCDRLYHLAALISFDLRKKEELQQVNGVGTRNILRAAKKWSIEKTVFVSSACTIGISDDPYTTRNENFFISRKEIQRNPYLESKFIAEREVLAFSKDQFISIVNPTTVYGPGDKNLNSGTLLMKVAKSSLLPVPPGGSNVVDIDDVVEGILAAGEKGSSGRRYILGGENLYFKDIFSTICSFLGRHPLTIPIPKVAKNLSIPLIRLTRTIFNNRFLTPQIFEDLFRFKFYSNSRSFKELNWTPKVSFRRSVERAWDYYVSEKLL